MFGRAKPRVVHLIDDTTAGGVMRVLDHLTTSKALAQDADHRIMTVTRGKPSMRKIAGDVIVSHLSISWRTLPALTALRLRHPFAKIVHVEHSYTDGFVQHNVSSKRRFFTLLRGAFRLFDNVVAVSDGQAKWIKQQALVSSQKLIVIRSYVDLSPFNALPRHGGPVRCFGAIGRLDRQKGFDVLIKAFRQVKGPDLRLSIYGEGPEEAKLRTLAEGDARIRFEGFANCPTAPYATADVVLMPSRWEAYGLVAIEALSAGCKLVCSGVDGLSDHADFGAELLPDNNVTEWVQAMERLSIETLQLSPLDVTASSAQANRAGWGKLLGPDCNKRAAA